MDTTLRMLFEDDQLGLAGVSRDACVACLAGTLQKVTATRAKRKIPSLTLQLGDRWVMSVYSSKGGVASILMTYNVKIVSIP